MTWLSLLVARRPLVVAILVSFFVASDSKAVPHKLNTPNSKPKSISFDTIESGDTLYSILARFGFSDSERNTVLQKAALPPSFVLVPGQNYRVGRSPKQGLVELQFYDLHRDRVFRFWKTKSDVGFLNEEKTFEVRVREAKGEVLGSLLTSIMNLVPSQLVAYRFMDAFKLNHNLARLQRGARFSLSYEEKWDGNLLVKFGEILRASLEVDGRNVEKVFVRSDELDGAFIDLQDSQQDRALYSPVNYLRISSLFQRRRYHPVRKRHIAHLGIDFELPEGEPVFAAQAGRIVKIGKDRANGNYVVLGHSGNLKTSYIHMKSLQPGLKPGQSVIAGQQIGTIGCTGWCTKPHLHFAVRKGSEYVNPAQYLKTYSARQATYLEPRRNQLLQENLRASNRLPATAAGSKEISRD